MQIVFFNVKTQQQCAVSVSDALVGENAEDLRLLIAGEVYRPVATTPDEVHRLNKLRIAFENAEFTALRQQFNITSKEDIPENFEEKFSETIDAIVKEKYSEYYKLIEVNKTHVYRTISQNFLSFVFMSQKIENFASEAKTQMTDPSYAIDYAQRFIRLFSASNWENQKTVREFSEELDKLKRFMDFDERRHAGYDKLLGGIGQISKMLPTLFTADVLKDLQLGTVNNRDPQYKPIFDQLYKIFESTRKYYTDFISDINHTVEVITRHSDDKLTGCLLIAKGIVAKFLTNTDTFLKTASVLGDDDKAKLESVKNEYLSNLRDFYDGLNSLFCAYDADRREVDHERERLFVSLWESTAYYRTVKEGAWYHQLAKLLQGSFVDLFNDVLTEEERKILDQNKQNDH